ncbi:MAG: hypothetical protein WDO74_36280 [Pseudomonadota bacterium]
MYEADEDTPALDELYAVKESLIGIQQPIKISVAQLRAPTEHLAPFSFSWSADGRWLMYGTTEKDDTVPTRWHAVRFDGGVPQAPVVLTDGLPPVSGMTWSPTGARAPVPGQLGQPVLGPPERGERGRPREPQSVGASDQVRDLGNKWQGRVHDHGQRGVSCFVGRWLRIPPVPIHEQ